MNITKIVEELLARPTFKEDLIFWLSIEAFQDVEGWRRWDSGDIGYSYPKRLDPANEDECIEVYPLLELQWGDGAWDWALYEKGPKRIMGRQGYKLGGLAAYTALAAYRAYLTARI